MLFLAAENVKLRRQTPPRKRRWSSLPRQLLGLAIFAAVLAFCAWSVEPMDPNPFCARLELVGAGSGHGRRVR